MLVDACVESMARFSRPHPTPGDTPIERRRWTPSCAEPHVRYRSIIEGRCPLCDGALERQELCGWCSGCSAGWTYAGSPTERDSASPRDNDREPSKSVHNGGPEVGGAP